MTDIENLQALIRRKENQLSVVLFANSYPRIATYLSVARAIKDAGHLPLVAHTLGTTLKANEWTGYEDVPMAQVMPPDLRRLRAVDLFFCPESVFGVAPADTVTVGIVHSIPDAGLNRDALKINYKRFLDVYPTISQELDYLLIAVRQPADIWVVDNYCRDLDCELTPEAPPGRRAFLDIVPAGYPKLDFSDERLSKAGLLDTILYTPTSLGSKVSAIRSDGVSILTALLEFFPNYNIVFRPYPGEHDRAFGRDIAREFEENSRFIYDESTTGAVYQERSIVSVTDSSSSAITFSLASGRPLVFARLARDKASFKNPLGYHVFDEAQLIAAVQDVIEHPNVWQDRIACARSQFLYNPGTASTYIANNLRTFAERKSHPDWLSIPRSRCRRG